jgi:hypothetical protein
MEDGMADTIEIELYQDGLEEPLAAALREHGLIAEVVRRPEAPTLTVRFATDERERLLEWSTHAIEVFLAGHELPLVVQRGNGGAVVRPPAD